MRPVSESRKLLYMTGKVLDVAAPSNVPPTSLHEPTPNVGITAGGAGRARTHDRRMTRGTLSCLTCASCTDITGHRTDRTRWAGIIRRRGPRTGPRPKASRMRGLRRCATPRTIRLLRLACRLQVVRSRAPNVLAAQMAQPIAPTAIAALGSADAPFHRGRWAPLGVITKRSDQGLAAGGRRRYAAPQTRPDGFLDGCRVARCPARSS
jgi:hypothetical protein